MKYTAEEVREWAAFAQAQGKLYAPMKGAHEPWEKLEAMLTAYADLLERIKADEGAVTDAVVQRALDAFDFRLGTIGALRAALLAVWPNPPAQAAQSVDVDKVREVIAGLRDYDDSAFNVLADKLEAAIKGGA